MWGKVWSMSWARNKEFFRDRGTLAWNFLFPFLIVGGFALAYSGPPRPQYEVGVLSVDGQVPRATSGIFGLQYMRFIVFTDKSSAISKVERHQIDLLVDPLNPAGREYWINSSSPKGYILEKILVGLQGEHWKRVEVTGKEVRYVDWLLPGVVGLNMMFSALFGVGYVIVRYRKNGVLKRLKATPISALEFLTAQVLSRLFIIAFTTTIVIAGCIMVLGVPLRGSVFDLALVFATGALCLISIGLIVASRVRSEELAGGLLNLFTWPMMFLSGVWFSLEGLNPTIQKIALIFPLYHVVSAARAIMIDGATLSSQAGHLVILLGVGVFCLLLGSSLFQWE